MGEGWRRHGWRHLQNVFPVMQHYQPKLTCVFSVFEAPDTCTNLWIALHQFKEQIPKLEEKRWSSKPYIALLYTICRGKKVRVFLCGDYQFLWAFRCFRCAYNNYGDISVHRMV